MEFGAGNLCAKAPVHAGSGGGAPDEVGVDSAGWGVIVSSEVTMNTGGQNAELEFGYVEPTGELGGVVKLETIHDAPDFSGGKGLVPGSHAVDVQVVEGLVDDWGVGGRPRPRANASDR